MLNNIRPDFVLSALGVAGRTISPIDSDVVFDFFETANAPTYYAGSRGGGGGGGGGGTSGCCASGTRDDVTYHGGNGGGGRGPQGNNH